MTKTCTTSLELLEGRREDFAVLLELESLAIDFLAFQMDFQLNVASALVELVLWAKDRKAMKRLYVSGVVGIMNYNSCLLP